MNLTPNPLDLSRVSAAQRVIILLVAILITITSGVWAVSEVNARRQAEKLAVQTITPVATMQTGDENIDLSPTPGQMAETPAPTNQPDTTQHSENVLTIGFEAGEDVSPETLSSVRAGLEDAFDTSPLASRVVIAEIVAQGETQAEDLSLLIRIQENNSEGYSLRLTEPTSQYPVSRLGRTPAPWDIHYPALINLDLSGNQEMEIIAGLFELAHDENSFAAERLTALQNDVPEDEITPALAFALAFAAYHTGQLSDALTWIDIVQENAEPEINSEILRGNILLRSGDPITALDPYLKAAAAAPGSAIAQHNLGLIYLLLENYNSALQKAELLVAEHPESIWSIGFRGSVYYARGDYISAYDDFVLAEEFSPGNPVLIFNQALCLAALGEYGQALVLMDSLIERHPNDAILYFAFGTIFEAAGQIEQALEAYSQAVTLSPQYVEAYVRRGRLRLTESDLEGAFADAEAATELDPNDMPAFWLLGDTLVARRDYPAALQAYSSALIIEGDPVIYAQRGWIYHITGSYVNASDDYIIAIQGLPDSAELYNQLGFSLMETARYQDAREAFQSALVIDRDNALSLAGLGLTQEALGELDLAISNYQDAIDLDAQYMQLDTLSTRVLWSPNVLRLTVDILRRMGM